MDNKSLSCKLRWTVHCLLVWAKTEYTGIFTEWGFQRILVDTSNANPWFWRVMNIKVKVFLAEGKHIDDKCHVYGSQISGCQTTVNNLDVWVDFVVKILSATAAQR